ncbi:hypothetical protein [Bacillus sp. 165]|uniref:hypothetical protein n=1 Tax=Bacillus sp. 165 TaxID=1529117 RepID=UPI001AD9A26D|nr:hypothetical protein [Bacillus sp. 165]MBO9129422.1 hypothetical protein [Bacillus sp. 165]
MELEQDIIRQVFPSKKGTGNSPTDSDKFKARDTFELRLQVKLKESAGNEFQGASLKVDFAFEGKQIDENEAFPKR